MSDIRDQIYLAALLHDIGKFYQRADRSYYGSTAFSEQSRRLAQQICPVTQAGYFSHQHVIWTNEFFEQHQKLFDKYITDPDTVDNVANMASYHHRPTSIYQAMIQLADWWASGLDRSQIGDYVTFDANTGQERFKEIPLSNILGAIKVREKSNENLVKNNRQPLSFRLKPLSLEREGVIPTSFELNSMEDYEKLWNQFEAKLDPSNFNTTSLKDFNITLFHILKQYTWNIPSYTQEDFPCISLFEHLKITSAITQCFFDYYIEDAGRFTFDDKKKRILLADDAYPLQLACFDLSGIQNFLYNISSSNAAKSLRGRSFYLQMLIESLYWYLIKELPEGFTPSHIVYASGGKFFMLLPNTRKVKQMLKDLSLKIQEELWIRHNGELHLNIGKVAFRYDNDILKDKPNIRIEGDSNDVFLGSLWDRIFQELSLNEGRKFHDLIISDSHYHDLFEPSGVGGHEKTCSITGLEYPVDEMFIYSEEDNRRQWVSASKAKDLTDATLISKSVKEQIDLGRKLVNHKLIAFGITENDDGVFYGLPGYSYRIPANDHDHLSQSLLIHNFSTGTDFPAKIRGREQAFAFRYFGGATVAMIEGEPKTFEDIAVGDTNDSFTKLGILRMDIDNLGKLFIDGFKEWDEKRNEEIAKNASFSAYAYFSELLDLFFSGYINTIREKDSYKDNVNIIYSGGDDLFAIGRWDRIIEFATEVRDEFRQFTGRDDITISAGIELVSPKFPVAKAAENAGRAETMAKNHVTGNGDQKNSLCLLGIPVNWDSEWPVVQDIKKKMSEWLLKGYITKGLIMFLLRLYEKWKHTVEFENKEDYSWKWIAAYNITRRQKNHSDPESHQALEELKEILFTQIGSNRINFDHFALACRLIELEYRTNKQ